MYAKKSTSSKLSPWKKGSGSQPNVQVRWHTKPEPPFRFRFYDLAEPNLEH